jgi:gamma-glutamyltranspeptidase/glutathione hydrolase
MVVTANPHATRAGEAVLRAGGSAVDAAVAIEAVLSLVEPQSSGFGGGGFMTFYDAAERAVSIYDGRETAPAGATPEMFLAPDGEVYGYLEAKNSGLSIGVPGVVAMLALAHGDHGALPWNALFDDAIRLSTEGFDVSPRLRSFLEKYGARLIPSTVEEGPLDAYGYFYDEAGELRTRLVNTAYADTLRAIRKDPTALYGGELAEAIVAAAHHPPRAGTLSVEDLAAYAPRRLDPLCIDYRELAVCGPPPPSSWVAVGMILGLLEAMPFPSQDRHADWAAFIEAQRLAYADRDHYVADDTRVAVPLQGMLNKQYLAGRAALVDADEALAKVEPGDPWRFQDAAKVARVGADTTVDYAGTTHFVVVDHDGNVVSMTASVESIFGSSRMAGGMFLNNQLTDFARAPRDEDGVLVANHAAPGKRPRSSMSPTIALDDSGAFRMATGSPGGNSIIAYTAKTLIGVFDWGLSAQEAVNLPNVVARSEPIRIESERADPAMISAMQAHGFDVRESAGENSGLSVVVRHEDGRLEGGVDPRREGTIAILPAAVE